MFSSSDDFTVQFVGHSGTAVASDPYRSFSCLWCFWWDYTNTRLWVGIRGRFHFCNRTIGESKKQDKRQLFGCTGHWGKLKLVSSEHCVTLSPPSRQMMTRFYKTIVVDITIMFMFIAMCNLCVKPHVWTCTRMLAQCVLRIMFMAYLNAVTLFALCRGLVHEFRGKSLSILWPFFHWWW